jgi:RES domain-containing protein
MLLWRLYRRAHGPGLDGIGGLYAAGRWHELGTRVVYFGASPGIVVLEKLAHIDPAVLPDDLVLTRFEGDVSVEDVMTGEADDLHDLKQTRARGARFFKEQSACMLRVRSSIVPEEYNLVFNPLHRPTMTSRASEIPSMNVRRTKLAVPACDSGTLSQPHGF